jgi:hypothetical protein
MADLKAAQQALNAAKDTARRRAMGSPLKLGDAVLDTLAVVSDADVPAADALWRMANPGPLADLLDATPAEEA